jgi:putative N6-adenine-specific DNA methylase
MDVELFVSCAQGLEPLLLEEIRALGGRDLREGFRGVFVNGPFEIIYRINYGSRLASRVLLPLKHFRCYNQEALYKGVSGVDWLRYIPGNKTFAIDANVTHKFLRNSLFAAQVVKDAICDQFRNARGMRPNVDVKNPDVQLNLYIRDQDGVIYFDTSGAPLHKRGYRIDSVEAPVQETLAAAMLLLARYKGDEIVLDPCCGSGTLLIEAAMMASKTPPGFLRQQWGFRLLPDFTQEGWLKVKAELDRERIPLAKGHFFGCDINKDAVRVSRTNLRAAGFLQEVQVVQADFREFTPAVLPNFVITNPPHGRRLDDEESLRPLYRALGDFFKKQTAKPGKGFVFTSSLDLAKEVGLTPTRRNVMYNSGIESRFLEFDLYA